MLNRSHTTSHTRRAFLSATSALGLAATGCARKDQNAYLTAVNRTWRPADLTPGAGLYRELIRAATLAPSSHNTQPWKFAIGSSSITVIPDFSRRCPEVDPDDHHLYVSLGCATENLAICARAAGLAVRIHAANEFRADLERGPVERSELLEAIPHRQSSRSEYDGTNLSLKNIGLLEEAAKGTGVSMVLVTGRAKLDRVAEFVAEGNQRQIGDKQWKRELVDWIRFNESQALSSRDGLYTKTTGNSEVAAPIGRVMVRWMLTAASQTKTDIKNIRSSPIVAVFTSESNDKNSWFEVGRCYERFALQATALGIRTAFVNQPGEVQSIRSQFASWLGIGTRRPDLIVRIGHGPEMPKSLRRPIEDVIVS